jgi:hypothetical protein
VKTISTLFSAELLFLAQAEDRREVLASALTSGLFGGDLLSADAVADVGGATLAARSALGATVEEAALEEVRSALRRLPESPDRLRVARVLMRSGERTTILVCLSSRDAPGCLLLFSFRPDGSVDVVLPEPGAVIAWSTIFSRVEAPDIAMLERAAGGSADAFGWANGVVGQRRAGRHWEEKGRDVTFEAYAQNAMSLLGETRA